MENLENQFRNILHDAEVDPASNMWQRILGRMQVRRRMAILWWTIGGIAAGFIVLIAVGKNLFISPQLRELKIKEYTTFIQDKDKLNIIKERPICIEPIRVYSLSNKLKKPATLDFASSLRIVIDTINVPSKLLMASLEQPELDYSSRRKTFVRRGVLKGWHMGMGVSSLSTASTNSFFDESVQGFNGPMNDYASPMPGKPETRATFISNPSSDAEHKTLGRYGISFYRALNKHWGLSTGISYSQLISKWNVASVKYTQRVHLIGIPISANYRFFSCERFNGYFSLGATMDINVASRVKLKDMKGMIERHKINVEDKLLWTLHGRMGVSYSLLRWVSFYGEVGVDRYLNAPSIATIRSEEKTLLIGQCGIRIGF